VDAHPTNFILTSANNRSGRLLRAHSLIPNTQFPSTTVTLLNHNTVIGYLEETSHGRFSNAVKDAANSAKQLGADAVLVESHGKSFEPIGALTNATITPSGGNATVTGTTIIAHRHTDRATVVLIKWRTSDRGETEAARHN